VYLIKAIKTITIKTRKNEKNIKSQLNNHDNDLMDSRQRLKDRNTEHIAHLKTLMHNSPEDFNRYWDAHDNNLAIESRIEQREHEREKYGTSRYVLMGTIESPEGKKPGMCKNYGNKINGSNTSNIGCV
jgi:hypothetical protein